MTVFEGVPTMYHAMLNAPGTRTRRRLDLRLCISGGSAMPVEVMRSFEKAFDCIILEGYGLSETSPVASFNHPDRERKPGSIGTPIEGVEMKVVDDDGDEVAQGGVGEIVDPRPQRDEGLLEPRRTRPRRSCADGWFRTGDMATVDEDGYFFIVDRKKDMIIRGGYNVYPREIEEVLYEHPAVSEAAVVGVAGRRAGRGGRRARSCCKPGAEAAARRHPRVRQGARRRLQVPAQDLVLRRAAEGPDGQDPQARDQGAAPAPIALTSERQPSRRPSRTESTRSSAAIRVVERGHRARAARRCGSSTRPPSSVLSSTSRPPGRSRGTSAS